MSPEAKDLLDEDKLDMDRLEERWQEVEQVLLGIFIVLAAVCGLTIFFRVVG